MIAKMFKNIQNFIHNWIHPENVVYNVANTNGLDLKFKLSDDGSVIALFQLGQSHEGHLGILHGGVIASILDSAMGNCLFAHGHTTVTAELNIRFRHPVITQQTAIVTAWISKSSSALYLLEAQITQDGQTKVTAKGKFVDQSHLADKTAPTL